MTHLPGLGPWGEGWVLVQGVLLVLVAASGWSLGPDWSGPLRLGASSSGSSGSPAARCSPSAASSTWVGASFVALAMSTVLAGFLGLKSMREEAWLTPRFPGYAAYRRRTKRFIPWIG